MNHSFARTRSTGLNCVSRWHLMFCWLLPLLTPACSDSDSPDDGSSGNGASTTESSVGSSDLDDPRMTALLQKYALRSESDLPILGDQGSGTLRQRLAQLDPQPTTLAGETRLLQVTMNLSKSELTQGKLDESIQLAESSYRRLQQRHEKNPLPGRLLAVVAYDLGVAYMRRAESSNC